MDPRCLIYLTAYLIFVGEGKNAKACAMNILMRMLAVRGLKSDIGSVHNTLAAHLTPTQLRYLKGFERAMARRTLSCDTLSPRFALSTMEAARSALASEALRSAVLGRFNKLRHGIRSLCYSPPLFLANARLTCKTNPFHYEIIWVECRGPEPLHQALYKSFRRPAKDCTTKAGGRVYIEPRVTEGSRSSAGLSRALSGDVVFTIKWKRSTFVIQPRKKSTKDKHVGNQATSPWLLDTQLVLNEFREPDNPEQVVLSFRFNTAFVEHNCFSIQVSECDYFDSKIIKPDCAENCSVELFFSPTC